MHNLFYPSLQSEWMTIVMTGVCQKICLGKADWVNRIVMTIIMIGSCQRIVMTIALTGYAKRTVN